ncbi:hypothetical protein [Actinoallomurus iriomotensis]|uniref:Dihydrodiol dehydrogenase n=1 Tax=Actinoallomurus iriomotensis TaxID=478107 RepID=A0A9W6VT05_9ACTN|nr:hypothetical protein [Actinoallomurus iriomotensis]GLY79235.1 hypothetical protein Airi01_075020 [Actinoallomurus iriomotensis]
MSDENDALIVANEFAAVAVRKVATRNGERLEIRSLGNEAYVIRLDALALEALTWSDPLTVGRGLETPLGPEPSAPGEKESK